ncbi:MAG: ABC transporter ATP-binding protein [Haloarculaceae archaeon]
MTHDTRTESTTSDTHTDATRLRVDLSATFQAPGADPFAVSTAFDVAPGETLVVLGPSGSGKSLLLESVAGFHDATGAVALDGEDVSSLPPERRDFGFVFQEYALFPHMTVAENVRFSERYRERTGDFDALVEDLDVTGLLDRYPPTLSGGEKQRVALARSLYSEPRVMLLDEPLSSLDVPTQRALRTDLVDALADVTTVYVTHDRTTARVLGDHIAVMQEGDLLQVGPPEEVFERPASPFVAEFTGCNCVPLSADGLADALAGTPDQWLAVRPEHVHIDPEDPDVTATVDRVVREDAAFRVILTVDGVVFDAFTSSPPPVGETVGVGFPEAHRTLVSPEGERRESATPST